MVVAVFGLPGNGKTSLLTKIAQLNLAGKSYLGLPVHSKVFTNFECAGCYKLDFNSLGVYHYSDALILIDEAMLLCDGRNWKDFGEDLKFFFSNARHYDVDICMCSQFWRDFDARIRNLVETYYLLEASAFLPVSYVKPITRFMGVVNGAMADTYELGIWFSWKIVFRPHWYKFFDSYTRKELPALPDLSQWDFSDLPPRPPTFRQKLRRVPRLLRLWIRQQRRSKSKKQKPSA